MEVGGSREDLRPQPLATSVSWKPSASSCDPLSLSPMPTTCVRCPCLPSPTPTPPPSSLPISVSLTIKYLWIWGDGFHLSLPHPGGPSVWSPKAKSWATNPLHCELWASRGPVWILDPDHRKCPERSLNSKPTLLVPELAVPGPSSCEWPDPGLTEGGASV